MLALQTRRLRRASLDALRRLSALVIQHDQVAVRDVESAEVLARLLGVVDVLVDDVGGALGRLGRPEANLSQGAVFTEYLVHVLAADVEGEVTDVQRAVDLGREAGEGTGGEVGGHGVGL